MRELLLIGIGGFIGAILRYVIGGIVPVKFGLPTGTLTVNLIGSFILGFFMYSSLFYISSDAKFFIATGFCGALTTFSTFSYETFTLIEEGLLVKAIANILINVLGCLFMVYVGRTFSLMVFNG
ncbi:fluoride efflux transporter CrcB [Methanotorris igneus]|uniref:Fluoride-specific ion channel FluC n=1 Tax=Methanotorris igneus (strain DSM 5666 / JCM 11834 / Kol 5) TaxID=880724 RepID=F6BEH8_METIK|nr:fluoride efflux transporter CrcB [Methanotorris igneus]AEF95639.1 CrcB-like protein [Methanotorris igneus Kol 5]